MKVFCIILYIIAILFTFHQTTYWGYGAASCPLTNVAAKERCLTMYSIYGSIFLILICIPAFACIIWIIRWTWKRFIVTPKTEKATHNH